MNHYVESAARAVKFSQQTLRTMENCFRAQQAARQLDEKNLRRAEMLLEQQRALLQSEETILMNLRAIA